MSQRIISFFILVLFLAQAALANETCSKLLNNTNSLRAEIKNYWKHRFKPLSSQEKKSLKELREYFFYKMYTSDSPSLFDEYSLDFKIKYSEYLKEQGFSQQARLKAVSKVFAQGQSSHTGLLFSHILKTYFFPWSLVFQTISAIKRAYYSVHIEKQSLVLRSMFVPVDIMSRELPYFVLFASSIFYMNEYVLNQRPDYNDLFDYQNNPLSLNQGEKVVILFAKNDPRFQDVTKSLLERYKIDGIQKSDIKVYQVEDIQTLLLSLLDASGTNHSIKELVVMGHGSPGKVSLNAKNSKFEASDDLLNDRILNIASLQKYKSILKRVRFSDNANIQFMSCAVSRGKKGNQFIDVCGQTMLWEKHGRITASNLNIYIRPREELRSTRRKYIKENFLSITKSRMIIWNPYGGYILDDILYDRDKWIDSKEF